MFHAGCVAFMVEFGILAFVVTQVCFFTECDVLMRFGFNIFSQMRLSIEGVLERTRMHEMNAMKNEFFLTQVHMYK